MSEGKKVQQGRLCSDRGATAVEYALLLSAMVALAFGGVIAFGGPVSEFYVTEAAGMTAASTPTAPPASTPTPTPTPTATPTPTPTATPTPTPTSTPTSTPTPTPSPSQLRLSGGSVPTSGTTTVAVLPDLSSAIKPGSVVIDSAPAGSSGMSVSGTASGAITFTAPKNKTGDVVVSFTYIRGGVTVTGNTVTFTVT